jgi:hypothetical protein
MLVKVVVIVRIQSENSFQETYLRDLRFDCRLDSHRQCDGCGWAALAGPEKPNLNDVIVIDPHNLHLTPVRQNSFPNLLVEYVLNSSEDGLFVRRSLSGL